MIPFFHDQAYSTIVLGGKRSPGVVKLSGHNRDKNWDVQAAKGQQGASSALNGDPIGQFQAEFYLSGIGDAFEGPSDFELWDPFQRLIESTTAGPKPTALPIYHPDLARNGFTEVVNGGVGGMIHDGKGGAIIQVKFIEYRPPKPKPAAKAQASPSAPTAGQANATKPDPNAAAKRELAGLLDQARST